LTELTWSKSRKAGRLKKNQKKPFINSSSLTAHHNHHYKRHHHFVNSAVEGVDIGVHKLSDGPA